MTALHVLLILAPLIAAAVIIGIAWAWRTHDRRMGRHGPVYYDEPMPWECSDYQPPARTRVTADHIIKED
jgi:hypothetical protein